MNGLTRRFYPIACVFNTYKEYKNGETWKDGDFKYQCKQISKEEMKYEAVACLTLISEKELGVGEKAIDGDYTWECTREYMFKKWTLMLTCLSINKYPTIPDACRLDDGSELPLKGAMWIGNTIVQCRYVGNNLGIVGMGKSKLRKHSALLDLN